MGNLWEQIKFWTRTILSCALALCALLFIFFNYPAYVEPKINLLFRSYEQPSLLLVLFLDSVLSIFTWWLVTAVIRTVRQMRESKMRSQTDRLEREVAEMKTRAAMLQAQPEARPGSASSVSPP
jgi:hypothetical protein